MTKKLLITIIFLLLSSCESAETHENVDSFKGKLEAGHIASYAILGDSITDAGNVTEGVTGGASSPDKGYASLLYDRLKNQYKGTIKFDNRGVGGQTVEQASARVNDELLPYSYDLIIVELGTNDWNYGTPLDKFREDYESLITSLKNGTRAEIMTISIGYLGEWRGPNTIASEVEYNKIIFEISKKHDIKSIDVRNAMLKSLESGTTFDDLTFQPDPVHPNDLGHELWADTVYGALINE